MPDRRLTEICLDFLERAYDWEQPDEPWLSSLVDAAWRLWGNAAWGLGLFYDASDVEHFRYSNLVFAGASDEIRAFAPTMLSGLPPAFVAGTYRTLTAGFGKSVTGGREPGWEELARAEVSDIFGINGLDPSGIGCFVGLAVSRSAATADQIAISQRLAAHLASAYRCRRRLRSAAEDPLRTGEAVLTTTGQVVEARGPAQEADARRDLEEAARTIEEVRGHRRELSDREPLDRWPPRVRARWTLVDAATSAGERYVVARENLARAQGLGVLTDREQQVVIGAAVGKTSKEIAYELGIGHSTARVLLSRACRRLGVRTREELLALPSIRALRGQAAS